ncbi:hypothetical protein B0O99DRAFT_588118 [Bisporella sp. PMI_857]|nr:hypothetical protein B0O99DRAFT_588118 [Bisporella sp. PMI_857]
MSNLLPNILTPPTEHSYHATYEPGPTVPIHIGIAVEDTMLSPTSMGNGGISEERIGHISEDEDMSEGGVELSSSPYGEPLAMTLSHAQALNNELDMLDAELMGPENMADMLNEQFSNGYGQPIFHPDMPHAQGLLSMPNLPVQPSDLPTAMSNLSQQLQQIQTEQEHGEFEAFPDAQHLAENTGVSGNVVPFMSQQYELDMSLSASMEEGNEDGAGQISLPLLNQNAVQVTTMPGPNLDGLDFPSSDIFLDVILEADQPEVEEQRNLNLEDFLTQWARATTWDEDPRKRSSGPLYPAILDQRDVQYLQPIERRDLQGERCDIQRLNWEKLGVSRREARQARQQTYSNYTNMRRSVLLHPRMSGSKLCNEADYFKFRRMDFDQEIHLTHFQLRNLLACVSKDHIFYACRSQVLRYPYSRGGGQGTQPSVVMDLTMPTVQVHNMAGIQVTTLTAAHNVLIAGGFHGEYAAVNLRSEKSSKHCEGILTDDDNAITNHVQVHLSRHSSLPLAAFSSNDKELRILDVNTNKITARHSYDYAINCSAISPDQRLRVLVGDSRKVSICNAETGEVLQSLYGDQGHRDFGFACDWADDGWTVATGNQDMMIKIWDARMWKTSRGDACPVATIAAEMAGVRKLKFSPIGSGRRVLVAAEPADIVSVIDAETFGTKQSLSFFGEIGGFDFANDGQDLIIANCDSMRGGIMHYERCGLASESYASFEDASSSRGMARWGYSGSAGLAGSDWHGVATNPSTRRPQTHRRRRPAQLGINIPPF